MRSGPASSPRLRRPHSVRRLARLGPLPALALLTACGPTDTIELKLAHSAPPESLIAETADEFARVANERLAGLATVTVYGSAQLGDDREVIQKLKLGTVDLSIPSTVMSAEVPAFALFDMPYVIRDREHLLRVEEEIFWPDIAPRAIERGLRVLALWENGFRHVTNSTRPIVRPEDLAGIKLRTPNSPWRVGLFRALGANPSPMPFAEVFMALQTGVMDGQENPLTNIVNASLDDVQTYLSLTGHVYSPAYLMAGEARWSSLPGDVRDLLEAVSKETQAFVLTRARELDASLLEELREGGMQINEIDRTAFVDASRPVYDDFEARVPGGMTWIRAALSLASERRP